MKMQTFTASILQDGEWFVAQCLEIDISSQGKSEDEAVDNLREAVVVFLLIYFKSLAKTESLCYNRNKYKSTHHPFEKEYRKMKNERLTLEEMEEKYPDEWLFIVDCKHSENTELLSGRVLVHSKSRTDIYNASGQYKGGAAIRYTGKPPEGIGYLL